MGGPGVMRLMLPLEILSKSLRTGFPMPIANEARQKRHRERPLGEMQSCVWRDAYLFVNGEQQKRQNIYCGRGDPRQGRRNQKTVLERQLHDRTIEQNFVPLLNSQLLRLRYFPFSLIAHGVTACCDHAHQLPSESD